MRGAFATRCELQDSIQRRVNYLVNAYWINQNVFFWIFFVSNEIHESHALVYKKNIFETNVLQCNICLCNNVHIDS